MIEYILALLLTSGVIFLAYKAGKRAGIKEEQLRIANEKEREIQHSINVISDNYNINADDINNWLQQKYKESYNNKHNMPTEF